MNSSSDNQGVDAGNVHLVGEFISVCCTGQGLGFLIFFLLFFLGGGEGGGAWLCVLLAAELQQMVISCVCQRKD